jgi:predicted homoserine dehydrogenase-like protein
VEGVVVIIVDSALQERHGDPVRYGMFGAGFMGRGILNQERYTVGTTCVAVCNRTVEHAVDAYREAGRADVRVVSSPDALDAVVDAGAVAVTDDPDVLAAASSIECVVEATGHVEYGARATTAALEHGTHVVLMNAELDGTVGSILKRRADKAGVVITGADGDQPAVQLNLVRFVRSIGLVPRVCGNIKGLQDHYRTPLTQAGFAKEWGQTPEMVTSFADGTKISFEQAIVANALGFHVAQRGMVGPEHGGHVDELTGAFDLDRVRELGGIVDYALGSQPGPGVFVFAEAHDDTQRHYLRYGKLGDGPLYSFYVPYHLTIFEVALTVARVVAFGDAAIAPASGPMVDVVALAKSDLEAGTVLDGLGGFHTYGVCENHPVVRRDGLLPMGLAEGSTLRRAVRRDEPLRVEDVDPPETSLTWELRAEQDAVFAASVS